MRNLTATICLTIAVLLGSAGVLVIPNTAEANFITAILNSIFRSEERSSAAATGEGFRGKCGISATSLIYKDALNQSSDVTALRVCTELAEQGIAESQNALGTMYANGTGVTQDNVYAHMWFNIAAISGESKNASKNRDTVAKRMTPAQIAEAQKLARECVAKKYKGC